MNLQNVLIHQGGTRNTAFTAAIKHCTKEWDRHLDPVINTRVL
jgi:hypothetical protein